MSEILCLYRFASDPVEREQVIRSEIVEVGDVSPRYTRAFNTPVQAARVASHIGEKKLNFVGVLVDEVFSPV